MSRNVCSNKNGENLLKLSNPGTFTQFDKILSNLPFLLLPAFLDIHDIHEEQLTLIQTQFPPLQVVTSKNLSSIILLITA